MRRREAFRLAAGDRRRGCWGRGPPQAEARVERALRGLPSPKITDVRAIATAPAGLRLVVVKITTDQDGLYGYGCATFTQRADLVAPAVERYLKPFLIGKPADRIDDIWQALYASSYWRNGPVLNNAISGVDMALWDIKGRQAGHAGLPAARRQVPRGGRLLRARERRRDPRGGRERPRASMARGFRHVRVQVGVPGMAGYGSGRGEAAGRPRSTPPPCSSRRPTRGARSQLLEAARKELGDEVELLHDVHERLSPTQAVGFCKDVERFRLFFLEDPLSPEDIAWFRLIRQQCATPLAMGELFNSPHEWTPADRRAAHRLHPRPRLAGRRAHAVPQDRGPGRAVRREDGLARAGRRLAGGPRRNVALDLACSNFGIQESSSFNDATREVFPGCPEMKDGYLYANEAPGWGIEVDEQAAAKYPFGHGETGERQRLNGGWGEIRRRDGTVIKQ